MNTENIPTPRTDAQYKEYARRDNDVKCVSIDFARQLEQELQQVKEDKQFLDNQAAHYARLADTLTAELQQAREELESIDKALAIFTQLNSTTTQNDKP